MDLRQWREMDPDDRRAAVASQEWRVRCRCRRYGFPEWLGSTDAYRDCGPEAGELPVLHTRAICAPEAEFC